MEFVVDTNIIVAAILRAGMTRSLILRPDLRLYAPEYLKEEIIKHKKEFVEKSGLNENEFSKAAEIVLRNIHEIDAELCEEYEKKAKQITPDKNDWQFFALALKQKCPIWSNDKLLKEQKQIDVINTTELAEKLSI